MDLVFKLINKVSKKNKLRKAFNNQLGGVFLIFVVQIDKKMRLSHSLPISHLSDCLLTQVDRVGFMIYAPVCTIVVKLCCCRDFVIFSLSVDRTNTRNRFDSGHTKVCPIVLLTTVVEIVKWYVW